MTFAAAAAPLKRTSLHSLHLAFGATMVPFAGYEMPVQYPSGILQEHLHTRAQAGLFDVSHMGQLRLAGADAVGALEALVSGDLMALAVAGEGGHFTAHERDILEAAVAVLQPWARAALQRPSSRVPASAGDEASGRRKLRHKCFGKLPSKMSTIWLPTNNLSH